MQQPLILIVGAADTGRAPMAAALLRRILGRQGLPWLVESAGVVGHDDDPAEPEARSALVALGLDIGEHRARSLTDELARPAALLLAVESGVARVVRSRYPAAPAATLGELAGRPRDIPDPFRMQLGAWIQYAQEIEALLLAGLPRLRALVEGEAAPQAQPAPAAPAPAAVSRLPEVAESQAVERAAAVDRAGRLLSLAAELPGVVDWGVARGQLQADLALMEQPLAPGDLARPYVALLRAMLALLSGPPSQAQANTLRGAALQLRAPISPADLEVLSAAIDGFAAR